ncbi:MAG: acyl carrier protein [Actinomycetota bacterium]|nr:acyl carrier protein [Actinomycetota bacterium]
MTNTADARAAIREAIRTLLDRKGEPEASISPESELSGDLGLDSREMAELSAILEERFGRDPFAEGIVPETVAELDDFYSA